MTDIFSAIFMPTVGVQDYFYNIFYYPADNFTGVMIVALAAIGIVAGIMYLIKRECNKKAAKQHQLLSPQS